MRKTHLHLAVVAIALLFFAMDASAQTSTLSIHVRDKVGASVARAHILIREDLTQISEGSNKEHPAYETTASASVGGDTTVELGGGLYDVCAFQSAFTAKCMKVLIKSKNQKLVVVLAVDPIASSLIGDTVDVNPKKPKQE